MPPLREGALPPPILLPPPPPSLPAPPRDPFPPLSDVEEELLDIAIRLDCGLREFDAQGGVVNIDHYIQCIVDELVSAYLFRYDE